MLNFIFPYLAWFVCIALLSVPGLWGGLFTLSLLGHLTQFIFKKSSTSVDRG